MLGSGRHKIESTEQFESSKKYCCDVLNLDGLVVIGGDDSNTNAALLAEYFSGQKVKTKVVGCPKTIDGDLKVLPHIPVSFGFDTACRTYSELVGNVAVDALSAQKYYHFARLMGRSASNIALEVALQACANVCLIGEEVMEKKMSLKDITAELVRVIMSRHEKQRKHYGVILLPEGLIEFIPEFGRLISEINDILAKEGMTPDEANVIPELSPENKEAFLYLPSFIREQLLLDRDPHGNVQVAKIETEKLLAATVHKEIVATLKADASASGGLTSAQVETLAGNIFSPQFHAFGYEGRAGLPSLFDSSYCYALGATAATLLGSDETGMIASVKNLNAVNGVKDWECGGVPVTALCVIERRKGKDKAVIEKALVELDGCPYKTWLKYRDLFAMEDLYRVPGPMQFSSECPFSHEIPITLHLELGGDYGEIIKSLPELLSKYEDLAKDNLTKPSSFTINWPIKDDVFLFHPDGHSSKVNSDLLSWRNTDRYSIPEALGNFTANSIKCVKLREQTQCPNVREEEFIKKNFAFTYGKELVSILPREEATPSDSTPANSSSSLSTNGKIGICFCGRQTPGVHDMVAGIVDFISSLKSWEVLGFVGGTQGLYSKAVKKLTSEVISSYRHTGGFELLGRTSDSLDNYAKVAEVVEDLQLDGLVIVGGCLSITNAAYLAEYLETRKHQSGGKIASCCSVIGIPASMGGSFHNHFVEQSLGFDSVVKATARLVGNTAIDGSSARKYYYFLRSMEDANNASLVTLETALQVKPNLILLGEEVKERRQTLKEIVCQIADLVQRRSTVQYGKKNFGTILIPDGLLSNIPEFKALIGEFGKREFEPIWNTGKDIHNSNSLTDDPNNDLKKEDRLASSSTASCSGKEGSTVAETIASMLTPWSAALFKSLPSFIVDELIETSKKNKGNVNLAHVETERMLAEMVKQELKKRSKDTENPYKGSFSAVCQFLGYQSRCTVPSDFDSCYGYALGGCAAALVLNKLNGYLAAISGLKSFGSDDMLPKTLSKTLSSTTDRRVSCGLQSPEINPNDSFLAGSASGLAAKRWEVSGVPFTAMLSACKSTSPIASAKHRFGSIQPGRVDVLSGTSNSFQSWQQIAEACGDRELYENPGPTQFRGRCALLKTEHLGKEGNGSSDYGTGNGKRNGESGSYMEQLSQFRDSLDELSKACRPGCEAKRLRIANSSLNTLKGILDQI